jgi:hypothetical protein
MRKTSTQPDGAWVLAGPAETLARLAPLIEAHRRRRPVRLARDAAGSVLNDAAAVLVVGDAAASPGRALPGVFLGTPGGGRVAAGWLPAAGERLADYAARAADAVNRGGSGPAAVLGELDPRALALAERVQATLSEAMPAFNWTAQRLTRDGLCGALGCGPGIALYVGHALAGGWLGYGGFRRDDLAGVPKGRSVGALLSISCSAASRPRHGLSFCEEAVLGGVCITALGARGKTLHAENVELAMALARTLASERVTTLAELLLAAPTGALSRYRILGDPLVPLAGAAGSEEAARSVFAPAPDDPLPVIPLDAWALVRA